MRRRAGWKESWKGYGARRSRSAAESGAVTFSVAGPALSLSLLAAFPGLFTWTTTEALWAFLIVGSTSLLTMIWAIFLRGRVQEQTGVLLRRLQRIAALEERYRDLFENANDMIFTLGLRGHFTTLNQVGERITEYPRTKIIGMSLRGLVVPEHSATVDRMMDAGGAAGIGGTHEVEILSRTGRRVPLEIRTRRIYSEGMAVGIQGIARDVTERKRAEELLVKAFNANPEPITISTLSDGVYIDVNRAFLRTTGYARDEVIGRSASDLRFWADPEARAALLDALKKGPVHDYEITFCTKSGELRTGLLSAEIIEVNNQRCLLAITKDVSEHRRAEEALAVERNLLRTLVDTLPDFVYAKDAESRFLMANRSVAQTMGAASPDELIGKTDFDFYPRELAEKYFADEREVLRTGRALLNRDEPGRTPEGNPFSLLTSKVPFRDASGEIVGIVGVGRDITERKMVEEVLKEYEKVVESAQDMMVVVDRGYRYRMANQAFLSYRGLNRSQIFGMTVSDVVGTKVFEEHVKRNLDECFKGNTVRYEARYPYPELGERDLSLAFYPTAGPAGIDRVACILQDITERKQIEGALRETNELLQAVIHASPLAVMSFDRHGNVGIWNSAAERIFGWSEQEVLGHFNPLVTEANKREFLMLLERVLRGESITGMELRRQRKDGSLIDVSVSSAPLRDANDRISGIMSVIAGITERKRAEEVIRRNYDTQTAINWILHISLKEIPLDSVLKQALDLILSIPWLSIESQGSIFLVENDPDKLVMKAQRGLSDYLREECKVVPFGKCLCGRAAARGEVQFAGALDERHEIHYEGMDPHGHYCVPIIHAKRVLGVINLYLKAGHRRDQKEIEFLNALADALAGIIQRKRIENDREKLIGDLRSAFDVISRSHKEWQDTFDSITDMISIVDENFTILKANRAFSAYYGLRPQDVINKKCYELIHDGDSPIPDCSHRTTMAEKKASGGELFDKRTKRTFSIFTFPYNSPDGEILGSIHIMRDITDDKEQEMRLITSERLAALGQMASAIAHEINNPLASIAGRSEEVLSRVRKGQYEFPLFESSLNIIQEEVFRCKSITTAMLSLVRKATDEKKSINLPEALDKTMEIIGFQGRMKNIEVVKKYQEPLPMIHGNEDEFRQVLLAVITNALDAMHDKGKLTIEAETGDR